MARSKKEQLEQLEAEEKKEAEAQEEVKEEKQEEAPKAKKAEPKKNAQYKIFAINKSYSGISGTVEFKDGVGITDNEYVANFFKDKGCEVETL